ncbi:hypothetical protein [Chelativorans sp. AA-79]|uniref:hypothetical protein n=1 Tax=Chelativorans sp. AA-79 TaxID=3028735 RepID=UPI0023F89C3C|nr:hypothetical protein [Chelativorans sp. AA-79]WEX12073.1 hypothetical protein PVE73_26590 [Chelativorans sp. AA-79]
MNYALPPYDGAPRELNEAVLPFVVDWIHTAYMLARKFGGLDNHCRDFFDYSSRAVLRALANGDLRAGVEATIAMANWATTRGHLGAEGLTKAVFHLAQQDFVDAETKARIEMLFLTHAAQWTDRTPVQWARHLLETRREHLREHEIFQAMAVATDDLPSWTANSAEILAEIAGLSASYYERSPRAEALISLESRASVLMPLIYCLTRVGSVEDIMDVLWAGEVCLQSQSVDRRAVRYPRCLTDRPKWPFTTPFPSLRQNRFNSYEVTGPNNRAVNI